MMKLSSGEKKVILATVITLVSVLIYYGFYCSFRDMAANLDRQIGDIQRSLAKMRSDALRNRALGKSYADTSTLYKQPDSDARVMSFLLSEIEYSAGQVGLRLIEIKPQRVKKEDFYNRFPVNLVLEGDLPVILHFIYLLQYSVHQFGVDSLSLGQKAPSEKSLRCELVLSRMYIP